MSKLTSGGTRACEGIVKSWEDRKKSMVVNVLKHEITPKSTRIRLKSKRPVNLFGIRASHNDGFNEAQRQNGRMLLNQTVQCF